jgi:hypothetical protein
MTSEFTYYALFLMLALTTGVVFQFFLGQLKKIKTDILKMNASIVRMHTELSKTRQNKNTQRLSPTFRRGKTVSGHLELEYGGRSAQTKAIFHIDKET